MQVLSYPVGELQANCYILIQEKESIIIDPGDSADFLLEQIQLKNLNPVAMIATHGHFDHIMAAGEIQLSYNLPLLISDKDLFLVKRVKETAEHFLQHRPNVIPPKTKNLKEGEFKISSFNFQILSTPGHTPGSLCLLFDKEKVVFTGDTLFKGAIGRYDFSYSDKIELKNSLRKLFRLPSNTIVYPGHGEATKVANEMRHDII